MKAKLVILFFGLFIISGCVYADDFNQAKTLFYKGNAYYSEEKFKEAIAQYENILRLGFESGELYYNLGNAYFKSGSLGKAILNYLRAKRFISKDADLNSNLEYAQSLIKEGADTFEKNLFSRIFFHLRDMFSLDSATLLVMVLYFIFCGLIIFIIVFKRFRRQLIYLSIFVFILMVICKALFFSQFYKTLVQKEAVVVVKSSEAKFEPFSDATTFFALSEGESVIVISSKQDWVKIKRLDGKQGWIKKSEIEVL